jgi:hypothetical protein
MCGRKGHLNTDCIFDYHPDANKQPGVQWIHCNTYKYYENPKNGGWPNNKKVLHKSRVIGQKDPCPVPQNVQDILARSSSEHQSNNKPSGSSNDNNRSHSSNGKYNNKGEFLNVLSTSASSNDGLVPIFVLMNEHRFQAQALVDTGALAGSYISTELKDWLKANGATVAPCLREQVCSAFTNTCSKCLGRIVNLKTEIQNDLSLPVNMDLNVTVIDSPFDLIIGRPDIKQYKLIDEIRSHFTLSSNDAKVNDTSSLQISAGRRRTQKLNETLNGLFSSEWCMPACTEPTLNTHGDCDCSRQPTPCAFGSNNLEYALNHVSTLYRKEDLIDVIDGDTDDPFWKDDITSLLPDGIQLDESNDIQPSELPNIVGETEFHNSIRTLLESFKEVFSKTVSTSPAKVPPMELELDVTKWQNNQHRGPPRPQTPAKQEAILESLNKLLTAGVIRPSQASEYSQVLLVPKPDKSWRFCCRTVSYHTSSSGC